MKLFAISDLHLGWKENRQAVERMPPQPDDWLIVAGDLGETRALTEYGLEILSGKFAKLLWTPGNHDLWCPPSDPRPRGVNRYLQLVELCRRHGVLTPEDPYALWQGEGGPHLLAPIFVLYDYTFRPSDIPVERALDWAVSSGVLCADEQLLHPDPYSTVSAWCRQRCLVTEDRLDKATQLHDCPLILINHFPLRQELARLPRIPAFSIWCGTRRTHDWHRRFRAAAVVSGHIHIRRTDWIDGVRFEEVSLGYPRQWRQQDGAARYLRQILPPP